MKILFITHYFAPDAGAAAIRFARLAKLLAQRGHHVTVLCPMPHYPNGIIPPEYRHQWRVIEDRDGVRVIHLWLWASPSKKTSHRLISQLSFMMTCILNGLFIAKPDVMLVENQPIFTGFAGWLISKFKRTHYVANISDYWPEYLYISGTVKQDSVIYRIFATLANISQQGSSHLVILWEGLRESIQSRLQHHPPISLIHNAVDLALFQPRADAPEFRQKYQLGTQKLITFLGVIGPHIDLETMLSTARAFRERSDVAFLFVGTGSQKDALASALESPDLAHCRWMEWLDYAEIPAFWQVSYAHFWALHDNPIDKMRFQAKLFEALATGTPTVIAVEGLMSQLLGENQMGITVPHGDSEAMIGAITRLLDDPDYYETISKNARAYAEVHFDAERNADAYEKILIEAVDSHKP